MCDKVSTVCYKTMVIPCVPKELKPRELKIYLQAKKVLSNPKETRGSKVSELKTLLRGNWKLQGLALAYLGTPKWISYLKKYPSSLARYVEKIANEQITQGQYVEMSREEVDVGVCAHRIWKKIEGAVFKRRMGTYIGDRCNFFESRFKKLEKGGLERLYKSVTSFRPPRECPMLRR